MEVESRKPKGEQVSKTSQTGFHNLKMIKMEQSEKDLILDEFINKVNALEQDLVKRLEKAN
jgi:hypothetical protein